MMKTEVKKYCDQSRVHKNKLKIDVSNQTKLFGGKFLRLYILYEEKLFQKCFSFRAITHCFQDANHANGFDAKQNLDFEDDSVGILLLRGKCAFVRAAAVQIGSLA
jgi:hypothetical protein